MNHILEYLLLRCMTSVIWFSQITVVGNISTLWSIDRLPFNDTEKCHIRHVQAIFTFFPYDLKAFCVLIWSINSGMWNDNTFRLASDKQVVHVTDVLQQHFTLWRFNCDFLQKILLCSCSKYNFWIPLVAGFISRERTHEKAISKLWKCHGFDWEGGERGVIPFLQRIPMLFVYTCWTMPWLNVLCLEKALDKNVWKT